MNQQLWFQNYYRVRKKVLAIGNKYWIEDKAGNIIGFSKQKILKLKEDIRIYSDEKMTEEVFKIKQQQILDVVGNFAVIDSKTEQVLGFLKRKALKSSFLWDEWEIYDPNKQLIGQIKESAGLGILRKFLTFIPEKMTVTIHGQPVATVTQRFKVIGDIWELNITNMPQNVDRRVILGALILMAMIERQHK